MTAAVAVAFDAVVAVDEVGGIGHDGGLPWPRLRGDLAAFKRITSTASEGRQNALIMGRTTWESIGQRALPGRINVVVSRRPGFAPVGAVGATSLDHALAQAVERSAETIFVVGGAKLYAEAFADPRSRTIYLTRVAAQFPADTFLPSLDGFTLAEVLETGEDQGIAWRLERWTR